MNEELCQSCRIHFPEEYSETCAGCGATVCPICDEDGCAVCDRNAEQQPLAA